MIIFAGAVDAQIEHGTLDVADYGDPPTVNLLPGASPTVSVAHVNFGDYWLSVSRSQSTQHGVMISSIAQNGYEGSYATSSVEVDGDDTGEHYLEYFLPIHRADSGGGDEFNMDVAFAFFPYDEFLGGHTENDVNGGAFTNLLGSATTGIALGNQFNEDAAGAADDPDGVYTLNLLSLDSMASPANGILLVSGGKNEDNYALSKANLDDGTFTLYTHDNFVNGDEYERDPIAFVYLPAKEHPQIPALGRVHGDGSSTVSHGAFTATYVDAETRFRLEIPGHSPNTGTLIISPEGGDGGNVDNIWSYEWDARERRWVIESRDLTGLGLQDLGTAPAFSFAFVTKPPLFVDADATGANDGSSWENAYTSLWQAARDARPGDQLWVAAGTYLCSKTTDVDDSIELRAHVKYYGGFSGNETLLSQRDPFANETTITGELGDPDDDSDNAYHVVKAQFQLSGYNRLDGFTITGGRARNFNQPLDRGPGLLIETREPVEIVNCRFLDNVSEELGGAVSVTSDGVATFRGCVFKGNQAISGGAVYVNDRAEVDFINCVFQGNVASAHGGGVYAFANSHIAFVNCSLQGNRSALSGSAIYYRNDLSLHNSVIWGNQQGELPPEESQQVDLESGPFIAVSNSLIQGQAFTSNGNLDGTDPRNNPRFLASVDPGQAPTTEGSLALRNTSPLIDHGDGSFATGDLDVSGHSRQVGQLDIGAYEASDVFAFAPNVAVAGDGPTEIPNWFPEGSIETYQNRLTQRETYRNPIIAGGPFVDNETGAFSLTLDGAASAFINYTLTLDPNDGSHAPAHLDFTVKAGSQTLYVDPFAYGGDQSGSSWANALPTVARTLEYSESGDTIYVAAGRYRPDDGARYDTNDRDATFQLQSGVALYGGFPAGGADLADRDYEANETILDGSDLVYHVVTGSGADATAVLDGFTIRDGYYNQDDVGGAGLLNDAGSPTIANCTFVSNYCWTPSTGAAMANHNGSSPTITNCVFRENQGPGAAIANLNGSNPVITDCVFDANSGESSGGAIYNLNSSPHLSRCHFEDNVATFGGAIYNLDSNPTFAESTFLNNQADDSAGAVYNDDSSPIFQSCAFEYNRAGNHGGAFYLTGSGTTTLLGCAVTGNHTNNSGGAIYKLENATIVASETRFESNFVESGSGGAIFMSAGSAAFENVDFVENSAASGGALYAFFGQLDIRGGAFTQNRSHGRAGALMADQTATTIDRTQFHGNRARSRGGAIEAIEATVRVANSVFVRNLSESNYGGAIVADTDSSLAVLNAAFTENRADGGGAIWAESPVLLTNSILWQNQDLAGDPSQTDGPGGIAPESANNIIQGLPGGFDPLFVLAPDPLAAEARKQTKVTQANPHYGNLRLQADSPAIDAGVNPDEPSTLDLGGNARIQNATIDIGPYEGYRDDYEYLFGHLDPDADSNGNGLSNYHDYAAGYDPEARSGTFAKPRFFFFNGNRLTFLAERIGREDVFPIWEISRTLEHDSWRPLVEGEDYTVSESSTLDDRLSTLLNFGPGGDEPLFIRQGFRQTPPSP